MDSVFDRVPVALVVERAPAFAEQDALAGFETLRSDPYAWLLDSALADGRLGRFSFYGSDPWAVVRARGRALELEVRRAAHPGLSVGTHTRTGDPFDFLRALLPAAPPLATSGGAEVPFLGGAVGFFGYELAEQLEPVKLADGTGAAFPDLVFLLVDGLLAVDHESARTFVCGLGFGDRAEASARARVQALRTRMTRPPRANAPRDRAAGSVSARHDADSYAAVVRTVKAAIEDGDLYQACLTHRLELPFAGDPWSLYRRLRRGNPAPFAAYLDLPEGSVLSSSPERFLRLDAQGEAEARPIKGTRAFVAGEESASVAARVLSRSEKDRAENVMIVDLYRNDLGRVCETGSVHVPELFAIERYGALQQMVSTISGRLAPGRDAIDLVRAAFPPGSMTGAPKIAAMRLLAELEPERRGVYSGALGYLDARGGMDLSVVIRTILLAGGRAHVHVGGGIVADSGPRAEYEESMDKARALLRALATDPSDNAECSGGLTASRHAS